MWQNHLPRPSWRLFITRPEPVSEANTQALLFVLLREFAFEQLPSKPRIEMKAAYVNFLFTLWLR